MASSVRQFRQILLWPLQLMPIVDGEQVQAPWGILERTGDHAWQEVRDEFECAPEGDELAVVSRLEVDLIFFYDLDVAILSVEIHAEDLPLARAQGTLFRFGRAYPTFWTADGRGRHCLLSDALNKLVIQDAESVRRFKRSIRQMLEIFLRFTHRYWFHEVSDQPHAKALYGMTSSFLGNDALYDEVHDEVWDMSAYLEADTLRRQANTVVRLTVVTAFGLIGTVATGFLGMNLFALSELSVAAKLAWFVAVLVPVTALTFYTIVKSKRLSDFLEARSDERMPARSKLASLLDVWRKPPTTRL